MSVCQTLVANKKYKGLFVAMKSFTEKTVIASGKKPENVVKRAHEKGYPSPVIVFIPEEATTHVY